MSHRKRLRKVDLVMWRGGCCCDNEKGRAVITHQNTLCCATVVNCGMAAEHEITVVSCLVRGVKSFVSTQGVPSLLCLLPRKAKFTVLKG